MNTATIGGLEVSRVGMGGCPLGGHGWGQVDDRESIRAVHAALDQGVNFFDTADIYGLGHSERVLAEALGAERSRVVIASKFGVRRDSTGKMVKDIRPEHLRRALEGSLRRLRLERLPLYYIHWPDGSTPIEDAVGALERCREQGKVHAIGVSNFNREQLEAACDRATIAAVQVQYSLADREAAERLLPTSRRRRTPVVTWGSLAQGLLTGKFDGQTRFDQTDRRSRYDNFKGGRFQRNLLLAQQVQEAARRLGRTPAQVAMRWLLDTPGISCVLFGAKSPQQVKENVVAGHRWKLPAAEYSRLARIAFHPVSVKA